MWSLSFGLLVGLLYGARALAAAGIWAAGASAPSGCCSCPRIRALRRSGAERGDDVASTAWLLDAMERTASRCCPRRRALRLRMRAFGLVIKGICSNNSAPDSALAKTNLSDSERLIDTDS